MEIEGTETVERSVSIELSLQECFSAMRSELLKRLKLPSDVYEKDGKLCQSVEYYGSHRWEEEEVIVAKPTKKQLELLRSLSVIGSTIWEMPDRDS